MVIMGALDNQAYAGWDINLHRVYHYRNVKSVRSFGLTIQISRNLMRVALVELGLRCDCSQSTSRVEVRFPELPMLSIEFSLACLPLVLHRAT